MRAKFGLGELIRLEIVSVRANLLPMVILWGLASEEVAHVAARELMDLEYEHLAFVGYRKPIYWSAP